MIKNYLLITFRSMMKSKLFISINVLGMAVSIACCIVAYYNYDFNASFDEVHVNKDKIYRVNMSREYQSRTTHYGLVPIPLGEIVRQNMQDAERVTRYSSSYADIRIGDEVFGSRLSFVDPDFFSMFTFNFIGGDASAISKKSNVLISERLAIRLFGTTDVVGKVITHILREGVTREFEIAAVYNNPPTNSSFNDDAITLYDNYWEQDENLEKGQNWTFRNTLFVQIDNPDRIPAVEAQLKPFIENNNKVREDFIIKAYALDPLTGMAVRDEYTDRPGTWTRDASPLAAVVGVAVMAIFVLLIACFNLTNTAIAISSRRLKEIGIRKVMGSMRTQLIFQFIGETLIVCFFSLLLGIAIAEFLLIPAFNALWPYMELQTNYFGKPDFLLVMIGILLFTSLLAGGYPAFYISQFQPTTILKGKQKLGGTNVFTQVLLTLQFAISLIGIVCSLAFIDNARYQRDFDMGFNQKEVLFTWVNDEGQFNALRDVMAQHPDVISIAGSEHHIFSNFINDPVKHESVEIEVDIMNIGDNYLKTAGFTLVQGRDFEKDSETDRKESVIVSEKLVTRFGWDNPIGKELIWMDTAKLYVIGVFKNVYTNGLWEEMEPMMLRYCGPEKYRHLLLSAPADKIVAVNTYMEEQWKNIFPNRKFGSRYMDSENVEANQVNTNIVKMFVFLGIVAMMLSITGLFTLVSLNIIRRMKEIGVRKVLGASIANISKVINMRFAILLLIACAIGSYGGAYMAEMLMDSIWDFFQRTTIVTMLLSSGLLLLASIVTVAAKTYNTARMNPVNVLRDE